MTTVGSIPHTQLPQSQARDLHVSGRRVQMAVSASAYGAATAADSAAVRAHRHAGDLAHVAHSLSEDELSQEPHHPSSSSVSAPPPRAAPSRRRASTRSTSLSRSRSTSASASSVSPHPFLRAHTGSHAHPHLPQRPASHILDDDIELELSAEGGGEDREEMEEEAQQLQQDDDPIQALSATPPRRYPFVRRDSSHSPQRHPVPSSPAPPTTASAGRSVHPLPTVPPVPGSTIASFIQRFREQPPQPPASRSAASLPFWWAATDSSVSAPPPADARPLIPALRIPTSKPAGMSTAEHLRQMEADLDTQRQAKRQHKLAQQMRDEQAREAAQRQAQQAHQHAHDLSTSFTLQQQDVDHSFTSSGDLSLLDGLDASSMLSPQQHAHAGTADAPLAESSRYTRQSVLDDSDDFAALLPPPRSQPSHPQPSHIPSYPALASMSSSHRANSAAGGVVPPSSQDVDELLRQWRAERAGGATVPSLRVQPLSPLHPSARSTHTSVPPVNAPPYVSARMGGQEDGTPAPAATEVEQLIAHLKKRLGIDDDGNVTQPTASHYHTPAPMQPLATHTPLTSYTTAPTALRSAAAKPSAPAARVLAHSHAPTLESMLHQPKLAEREYLDSARRPGTDPPTTTETNQSASTLTAAPQPPVIPPLKLPMRADPERPSSPVRTPPRSSQRTSSSAALQDLSAGLSPPASARDVPAEEKASEMSVEEAKYADPQPVPSSHAPHHSSHPPPPPRDVGSVTHLPPPPPHYVSLLEYEALQRAHARELAKAECAKLLRRELRRERRAASAGRRKSKTRTRGVISIHIEPVAPTENEQHAHQSVQPAAPPPAAPATDVASAPPPSSLPSTAASDMPVSAPAVAAPSGPAIVHYISNVPLETREYSLPSSPARRTQPRHQDAAGHEHDDQADIDAAASPRAPVAKVTEVHTRGLICDPEAYSTLVQQLRPMAAEQQGAGAAHTPEPPSASDEERKESAPHSHPPPVSIPSVPSARRSDALFSPSSVHLARLCAELGITVAEYHADAPLRALVQQLDALQTQQAQVHAMQHAYAHTQGV